MINLNDYEKLGIRIRLLRQKKNMSIEDLAFECEINKNYLGDLERGKRNPTLLVIHKIANGLGISLEELFKGLGKFK